MKNNVFSNRRVWITILVLLLPSMMTLCMGQGNCKEIIGYYPSWQLYSREGLLKPKDLDYSKYTIINYAFFQPDSLGNIYGTDGWADTVLLRGNIDWQKQQPAYHPYTSLIDYAHQRGVKVMLSIGGWTLSDQFPQISANPEKRARMASSCASTLRKYRFDGIDIDWEYPGYADHHGTLQDKQNFTLLLKAIRDSIDVYGKEIGQRMLLTAALGAAKGQMDFIEWEKITPFMDYFNMMTYDFNGTWNAEIGHNSPLYEPEIGGGSLDACYRLLTGTYGVPASKINLGIAFYGRSYLTQDAPRLYGPHTGKMDNVTFKESEGQPPYFNLVYSLENYERKWDDKAKVPYLVGKHTNSFVSYDDETSVRLKAEYVNDQGCAGVIIWECTGDYLETRAGSGKFRSGPLTQAISEALKPCARKKIWKR